MDPKGQADKWPLPPPYYDQLNSNADLEDMTPPVPASTPNEIAMEVYGKSLHLDLSSNASGSDVSVGEVCGALRSNADKVLEKFVDFLAVVKEDAIVAMNTTVGAELRSEKTATMQTELRGIFEKMNTDLNLLRVAEANKRLKTLILEQARRRDDVVKSAKDNILKVKNEIHEAQELIAKAGHLLPKNEEQSSSEKAVVEDEEMRDL